MSEQAQVNPQGIIKYLREQYRGRDVLFLAKLFKNDDRVKTTKQILAECQEMIEHLYDEGGFGSVFNHRPEIEIRVEIPDMFVVNGKNEAATRMIQLLNIQKASSKGEKKND